jgi:lipoate-protein ligase A
MSKFHLLELKNHSIFEQLQIEEALLRSDPRNWCILNSGSDPAIVMGISGQLEQLVNLNLLNQSPIPIIRRYSGGGTVVVDQETQFITFICNSNFIKIPCYPEKILQWSAAIYRNIIDHPEFALLENDYVIGKKKFGGNAQYIRKERWLHHSSLLWDFDEKMMDYLHLPRKRPNYREERSHKQFLCRLKDWIPEKELLFKRLREIIEKSYKCEEVSIDEILPLLEAGHRKTTTVLKHCQKGPE